MKATVFMTGQMVIVDSVVKISMQMANSVQMSVRKITCLRSGRPVPHVVKKLSF